jgi:hypothetical protein
MNPLENKFHGWFRLFGSYWKMRKVSSDQTSSPVETLPAETAGVA